MEGDNHATFATADGIAVGTVDYMSPEQACGKEVDGRSDLYSLGCAMYHLITGRQAFPGDNPIERLGKRISGRPTPITDHRPDLPTSLVAVLDRLMATRPQDRYQTGREAADALNGLIRTKKAPAPAARPEPPPPPAAPPQRPPPIVVRPEYPGWFGPLARLAETRPGLALGAMIGVVGGVAGLGFLVGRLIR